MQIEKKMFPRPQPRDLYVIIPAAGNGSRMRISDSKQFFKIGGVPVLARTLLAFEDFRVRLALPLHVVIVTSLENMDRVHALIENYEISFVEKVVEGGATRQDSVAAGVSALGTLERVPDGSDIVFIHDGARCMVDFSTLQACFTGGMMYDVCVAATPCKNTIKLAAVSEFAGAGDAEIAAGNEAGSGTVLFEDKRPPLVEKTLDRSRLYEVQTPQVFKYRVLADVSARAQEAGISATDDTALAEALGVPVHLIPCSYGNIKITTPEDAALAEFMLAKRENDEAAGKDSGD